MENLKWERLTKKGYYNSRHAIAKWGFILAIFYLRA
jgi:hypothetical protein